MEDTIRRRADNLFHYYYFTYFTVSLKSILPGNKKYCAFVQIKRCIVSFACRSCTVYAVLINS